jgi:hypothetical protein
VYFKKEPREEGDKPVRAFVECDDRRLKILERTYKVFAMLVAQLDVRRGSLETDFQRTMSSDDADRLQPAACLERTRERLYISPFIW